MKNPFNDRPPAFDAAAIHSTIEQALASAGLDTTTGPMREVTEIIRRALGAPVPPDTPQPFGDTSVVDVIARLVPAVDDEPVPPHLAPTGDAAPQEPRFETRQFSNPAGSRTYKLYVPAGAVDTPRAIVVMLHGCTQSADDFATGTRMNRLADAHGFLVVYPEQTAQANPSKCWNWFDPQHQRRDAGEPSLIAGIVLEVLAAQGADPRRVFVAGLSAGAAMAVAMGETYPELFAGVGAHSGLPYGSAHDIPSALLAMKGGRSGIAGLKNAAAATPTAAGATRRSAVKAVPTIVFHGDRDHTVQETNGARIVQQAHEAHAARAADRAQDRGADPLAAITEHGVSPGGRRYRRTVHANAAGQTTIERWTLHSAGHAWSGGASTGSFTDPSGPDASAEMVRFFLALQPAGSA